MPKNVLRLGLSILVIGHLAALIAPPLAFQANGPLGTSPSVNTVFRLVQGYSQFLYLDRGYAFFAPDPGPSHLIQAEIVSPTGEATQQNFPDRNVHWPRLLYHRHFMITEFMQEIYQPPGPPAELVELDPVEAEYWVRARARYEHVRQSVQNHLQHVNPGHTVRIARIEHRVPDVIDYQVEPIELTDTRLYGVLLDQPIDLNGSGDVSVPSGPPEPIPPPSGEKVQTNTLPPEQSVSPATPEKVLDDPEPKETEAVSNSEKPNSADDKAATNLRSDPVGEPGDAPPQSNQESSDKESSDIESSDEETPAREDEKSSASDPVPTSVEQPSPPASQDDRSAKDDAAKDDGSDEDSPLDTDPEGAS